jgi:hypothetical protein
MKVSDNHGKAIQGHSQQALEGKMQRAQKEKKKWLK